MQAAWRLIRLGRYAEAGRVIRPAFENATLSFNIAATRNVAGYLAAVRGEFERAEALLDEAWEQMQHSGGLQLIGLALAWRIALCLWQDKRERAGRLAQEGVRRATEAEGQLIYTAELYWLATRVEADRALRARTVGDRFDAGRTTQEAESVAAKLAEAIAGYPGDGAPPEALAFELLVRAELSRARGEAPTGGWRAAAQAFADLGQVARAAYAEMREAEALAIAAAPAREVAEPLRRAHAVAVDCGIVPFQAEVEELARRARVDLPDQALDRHTAAERLGLTEREVDVLALLTEGRTNRQIGQELFITEKTASVHVSRILMKLGVSNRGEAAAAAHRVGLVRPRVPSN
jgi:DNA-binding NarL/FixJ family response regulator